MDFFPYLLNLPPLKCRKFCSQKGSKTGKKRPKHPFFHIFKKKCGFGKKFPKLWSLSVKRFMPIGHHYHCPIINPSLLSSNELSLQYWSILTLYILANTERGDRGRRILKVCFLCLTSAHFCRDMQWVLQKSARPATRPVTSWTRDKTRDQQRSDRN